jgi:hypothetical protein
MKVNPEIIKLYKKVDTSFIVNCGNPEKPGSDLDQDLIPIRISLPDPPELELIDGYGELPFNQVFKRQEIPEKLALLEKKIKVDLQIDSKSNINKKVTPYKIINGIWDVLEREKEYYEAEILWIKKQWWHRLNGYWFFNNGKPTYICGWHFMLLNYWYFDGSFLPEYRDRDRRELLAWTYFRETNESFIVDNKGIPILDEDGKYQVVEMPFRTFYGVAEPKGRRQGVSNKAQMCQYEEISRKLSALGVIFSITEPSATKLFQEITVRSFRKIPFFFTPNFDGGYDQAKEVLFTRPRGQVLEEDLQSKITRPESAFGAEFDGTKIDFAVFDEEGKPSLIDVNNRWNVHKRAMALGPDIIAFCIHPSTTEDMDNDCGKFFQKLVFSSNFYKRNAITGQTETGLVSLFFPSYDGHEKCIDRWGMSVIDDPREDQIRGGYRLKYGARKLIQSELDQYLTSKDPSKKIEYLRTRVKFPFKLADCFMLTAGGMTWNVDIINTRQAELRRAKEPFRKGNFEWIVKYESVRFVDNSEGKFEISKFFNENEANQKIKTWVYDPITNEGKEVWAPRNAHRGIIGSDPTQYKGTSEMAIETGRYDSLCGMAIYLERNKKEDPDSKPIQDHDTGLFIGSYLNRVLPGEHNEDTLMAAIYFGFPVSPERNKGNVWEYFVDKGFEGYLFYETDLKNGKYKDKPGFYMGTELKENLWRLFQNYIQFRGMKENHSSILTQISNLKTFEDLTKNDLAAACGQCLLASDNRSMLKIENHEDVSDSCVDAWLSGKLKW